VPGLRNSKKTELLRPGKERECQFRAVPVKGKTMTRACLDIVLADKGTDFTAVATETVRIGKMEVKG